MSTLWSSVVNRAAGKTEDNAPKSMINKGSEVQASIDEFNELFADDSQTLGHDQVKIDERKQNYASMVNKYYDLCTDFYEYGWGQSFHFAPRFEGESFDASLARHEHYLALKIGMKPGHKVLDVGCGVGGPMRAIARFSGSTVVGVNNNDYQILRCNLLNEKAGLSDIARAVKGDFMKLPFADNSFDGVYAIEATCHAPDKKKCFAEMYRTLKPGGYFAGYEWVMTPKYDANNAEHRKVKHMIEWGDSLPDLVMGTDVDDALRSAGFKVVESFDVAEEAPKHGNKVTWHSTLHGQVSLSQFKHTRTGRWVTQKFVDVLESIRIAPTGTSKTHQMLTVAADGLALGGEWEIFTPMYYFLAQKPLNSK